MGTVPTFIMADIDAEATGLRGVYINRVQYQGGGGVGGGTVPTFIMADIDAEATGLLPIQACIGTLNCCRGIRSLSLLQMILPMS